MSETPAIEAVAPVVAEEVQSEHPLFRRHDARAEVPMAEFSSKEQAYFFATESGDHPQPLDLLQPISETPRYYQINAVRNCAAYIKNGFSRLLYIQPTGTGKTLLAKLTALDKGVRALLGLKDDRKIRVLFIAGQSRLLWQARQAFADCTDSVELLTQSSFSAIPEDVLEQGWDLTFLDEAHHEAMISIQKLLTAIGDKPLFGLTATPERGDALLLKFERYIFSLTKTEAIRRKFIATPSINSIIDTGRSNKLAIAKEITSRHYNEFGQTIVYFKTKKECSDYTRWCGEQGFSAYCLLDDSNMEQVLSDFSAGSFRLLVNCQKLGEGVDIRGCTDVLLARQFHSKAEKEQYIGRAIRPDSTCTVWEFVNPLDTNILAKQLFPVVSRHRLIFFRKGEWREHVLEQNDDSIYDHDFLNQTNGAVQEDAGDDELTPSLG